MTVPASPKLTELLGAKGLTLIDLERRLDERFGLQVSMERLAQLSYPAAIQRADLEILGATATVLGLSLAELLDMLAEPNGAAAHGEAGVLRPEQSRRMRELFDQRSYATLSAAEERELEALVTEFGGRLHERTIRELADRWGMTVEQARSELAAEFDEAVSWWRDFEADPRRREELIAQATRRQARAAE